MRWGVITFISVILIIFEVKSHEIKIKKLTDVEQAFVSYLKEHNKTYNDEEYKRRFENFKVKNEVKSEVKIKKLTKVEQKFVSYLKEHNKTYNDEEYKRRFENFKVSLYEIVKMNQLEENAVFGLTKFSDMSKEEFVERMLLKSYNATTCQTRQRDCWCDETENNTVSNITRGDNISSSFDWRNLGVVKPVLNQKLCQGCWAFSIVGVLESMLAIQFKDYKSRSIEELIDCSEPNHGCYNGNVALAMDFICDEKLQFVTEEEYPLTLSIDKKCKLPTTGYRGRRVRKFQHKCNMNENDMVKLIATHGPLVVAVDASNWNNYIGGVISRACNGGVANHVVQIVGYEGYRNPPETTDKPYYIVRNSWGQDWGEGGYVKIAMHENVCGIAEQVTALEALEDI
ncbi:hypothetical protein PYW08_006336 [Mythimna loreyi]|uniref:Uncharacterized protein n=1 Tax=Mythimna loreyi TaxID=667449 RepID=A0ACC2QPH0_9NEOP|nr:hypothetical protein PYW08_006336 [Mythimna loreyi]